MPKLYKEIIKIAVLGGLLVVVQAFAFTEPSVAPPGDNVPAPLNVGGNAQTKLGGLILNTGGAVNGLAVASGNVGIGTLNPGAKLDVEGNVKIADGTQADGRFLVSDGNGVASWKDPYMPRALYGIGHFWGGNNCEFLAPVTSGCDCPGGFTTVVVNNFGTKVVGPITSPSKDSDADFVFSCYKNP